MKRRLAAIFLALLFILCMLIPVMASAEEEELSITPENGSVTASRLNDYIAEHSEKIASVAIVVFNADQAICSVYAGKTDMEKHTEADADTVYEWGSVTKLLTWVSVMQLYERGMIDLEADIYDYLPNSFTDRLPKYVHFTMLDLMNHSAGFQETLWEIETNDINKIRSLDDALISSAPAQTYKPGEVVSYSNWGAALAGYTVECISGMKFSDYVQKNIFLPLDMTHTAISPDLSDNTYVSEHRKNVKCYSFSEGTPEDLGEDRVYIHLYPAGAACGTAEDMSKFARAFLQSGSECPLFERAETLQVMLSPSRYFSDGTTGRICHGLYKSSDPRLIGHGGATDGFSSDLQLDIKGGTGYVFMTNTKSERIIREGLPTVLYGENKRENQSAVSNPTDISGRYAITRSMFGEGVLYMYGFLEDGLTIVQENGRFFDSTGAIEFVQVSDNTVEARMANGRTITFMIRKDADGAYIGFELYSATDYLLMESSTVVRNYVFLGIFVLGLLGGIVFFVIHAVRLHLFKGTPEYSYRATELLSNACYLFMAFALYALYEIAFISIGGTNYLMFPCIAIVASAVMGAGLLVRCWLLPSKAEKKAVLITESVFSVLVIVGVILCKLYQFRGF